MVARRQEHTCPSEEKENGKTKITVVILSSAPRNWGNWSSGLSNHHDSFGGLIRCSETKKKDNRKDRFQYAWMTSCLVQELAAARRRYCSAWSTPNLHRTVNERGRRIDNHSLNEPGATVFSAHSSLPFYWSRELRYTAKGSPVQCR